MTNKWFQHLRCIQNGKQCDSKGLQLILSGRVDLMKWLIKYAPKFKCYWWFFYQMVMNCKCFDMFSSMFALTFTPMWLAIFRASILVCDYHIRNGGEWVKCSNQNCDCHIARTAIDRVKRKKKTEFIQKQTMRVFNRQSRRFICTYFWHMVPFIMISFGYAVNCT